MFLLVFKPPLDIFLFFIYNSNQIIVLGIVCHSRERSTLYILQYIVESSESLRAKSTPATIHVCLIKNYAEALVQFRKQRSNACCFFNSCNDSNCKMWHLNIESKWVPIAGSTSKLPCVCVRVCRLTITFKSDVTYSTDLNNLLL